MITEITFKGIVPGLNGSNGLMRMHWSKQKKLKERFFWEVKAANIHSHPSTVKLTLVRHTTRELDYDNLVSTGKHLCDAIVNNGVILDDNQKVIVQREYTQVKCKRGEEKTVITISDV